jgi:hypothetical protein
MGARGRGALALALAVALLGAAPAARAADPALAALRGDDAYAATAVVPDPSRARGLLAREARRLADRGQAVKLAVVAGPVGAPTMLAYARDLRDALAYEGTLVVTAPGRPVVAAGPRTPAEITLAIRAAGANRVRDPVDRVIAAAGVVAPPPPAGSSWRGVVGLALLALLGGAWAAAWGIRRERRRHRVALTDARALAQLRLDAVRARALDLRSRPGIPDAARPPLEEALSAADAALAELATAGSLGDVARAEEGLRRGERRVRAAAALAGEPLDPDALFDGLCAVDPAHGAARAEAMLADVEAPAPLCADCAAAARAGEPPLRRMIPVRGRPVPFDEAEVMPADGERD